MRVWVAIVAFAAIGWAEAATFYVDSETGRDDPSRNGGASDPWQTITYALSRASGENTFMCRGTFSENVDVAADDNRSTFQANGPAVNTGYFCGPYEGRINVEDFDVTGYLGSGAKGYFFATDCNLRHPTGSAFVPARFYGCGRADNCVLENCKRVCSVSNWEFGDLDLTDCEIKDCESGITLSGDVSPSLLRCLFSRVGGVMTGYFYGEGPSFNSCEFYDCSTVIMLDGGAAGYWGSITDSVFRRNGQVITIRKTAESSNINITGNSIIGNSCDAIMVGGRRIKLRRNVVRDNSGHGVFITEGNPDLGTPSDPGGNTFAGNGSGYDVYNASSEDIMAYGNTWDAQTEEEMRGKTWEEVNVTRIYDHWDNPSFGYVRWSAVSALRPASVGQVKASFAEVPAAPAGSPEATATEN